MSDFFVKLFNLLLYWKWTNCRHEDWEPDGFFDWKCPDCGVWR
jgi:hypothetical protein